MTFDRNTHLYTLLSGRTIYAYGGVLGLGPNAIHASYGWDGSVEDHEGAVDEGDHMYDGLPLTPTERQEIAAEMIQRWGWWYMNPLLRMPRDEAPS